MSVEESVLADLEKKLDKNLFVNGPQPSQDDAQAFEKFITAKCVPDQDKYPSVWAWYSLMVLFEDEVIKSWKPSGGNKGQKGGKGGKNEKNEKNEKGGKGKKGKKEETPKEDAGDDDFDPFAEETQEDKEAKDKLKEKNKEEKKKRKKKRSR